MSDSPTWFAPLLGLHPYAATKGHGSFVTFSLTATLDAPREEYFVWIFMCAWRIRLSGRELAHSESSDNEIMAAVSKLNGRTLKELVFHGHVTPQGLRHSISLIFDEDLSMRLYQHEDYSPDVEMLKVGDAAGTWYSCLADGSLRSYPKA
ncbi:MAG: hypothetical protein ACYC67_04840 [Prosthecobacter sp.]|jgi:hypothetical protein